jgi:O-antigen ligase
MSSTRLRSVFSFENLSIFFASLFLFFLAYSEFFKSLSLIAMLLLFFYGFFVKKHKLSIDTINFSIISFVSIGIVGMFLGISYIESSQQISNLFKILLVFLFFREVNFSKVNYDFFIKIIFLGFLYAFIDGFLDYLGVDILVDDIFPSDGNRWQDYIKLRSLGSVNRSAVYYVFISMIALSYFFTKYQKNIKFSKSNILVFISLLASFIGILFSGSRMAIYSFPILILLSFFLNFNFTLKKLIFLIALLGVTFTAVLLLFSDSLFVRKIKKGLYDPLRMMIWDASLNAYLDNKKYLFGIGIGNSVLIDVSKYLTGGVITKIDNAHSFYIDLILEYGLLGFIFLMYFFYKLVVESLKKHKSYSYIDQANLMIIIAILLMGLANITFRYEFALLMATIAGLSLNKNLSIKNENTH